MGAKARLPFEMPRIILGGWDISRFVCRLRYLGEGIELTLYPSAETARQICLLFQDGREVPLVLGRRQLPLHYLEAISPSKSGLRATFLPSPK